MRTFAPPNDGDVVCTRRPFVSFSSIETSPGVIMIFSCTSSEGTTSTRTGSSSMRRSVRVAVTVTDSSIVTGGFSLSCGAGPCSIAAASRSVSTLEGYNTFSSELPRRPQSSELPAPLVGPPLLLHRLVHAERGAAVARLAAGAGRSQSAGARPRRPGALRSHRRVLDDQRRGRRRVGPTEADARHSERGDVRGPDAGVSHPHCPDARLGSVRDGGPGS